VATSPTTANGSQRSFTATYLDTEDRRLTRAGIELRRRVERGKSIWEAQIGGTTVRALGGPAQPPEELKRVLATLLRGEKLVEVARVRRGKSDVALLEGQHVLATFGELGAALEHVFPAPPDEPVPTKTAPAVEHVRAFLRTQLAEIERHDPAVRVGEDPEDLHKLRVAIRRSRAALREARKVLDDEEGRALRGELKWLGGELGGARDLDVLLARLRRGVAELDGADAVAADRIAGQLEAQREAAQAQLLGTLESPRYRELLVTFEQFVNAPPVAASDVSLVGVAGREFRRLERHVKSLGGEPSNDDLHRARIHAKRLRYATELSSQFLGKDGRKIVSAAKRFQDTVGAHQDAVVAEALIRGALRRSRGVGTGVAAGRLIERERARRTEARARMPKAWRRLRRRALAVWA
jgi:CHAD domain-containing protein